MATRRYLLVLDVDLLALDAELDPQPINYVPVPCEQLTGAAAAAGGRLRHTTARYLTAWCRRVWASEVP